MDDDPEAAAEAAEEEVEGWRVYVFDTGAASINTTISSHALLGSRSCSSGSSNYSLNVSLSLTPKGSLTLT